MLMRGTTLPTAGAWLKATKWKFVCPPSAHAVVVSAGRDATARDPSPALCRNARLSIFVHLASSRARLSRARRAALDFTAPEVGPSYAGRQICQAPASLDVFKNQRTSQSS